MMRSTLLLCLLVCSTHSFEMNFVTPLLLALPMSVQFQSAYGFTRGFFSLFRRREQKPAQPELLQRFPSTPIGPVSYARQPQAFSYPHQFGLRAEDFFPQYSRFPGFNMFQETPSQSASKHPSIVTQSQEDFDPFRGGRMDDTPTMSHEDAESFFTLLEETDEHKCISRLVCEMGASPETAGEFAQSVNEVFSSLQHFPAGSKVSHYNNVLQLGRNNGLAACASQFQVCDEESYNIVKNAQLEEE